MKKSAMLLGVFVLILALSSVACAFGGVQMDGNTMSVTIELNEAQVNQMLSQPDANVSSNVLLDEITSVDMQDEVIKVFGRYTKEDGTQAEGSYEVTFYDENGELKAEIVAVDIEGYSIDDPRVAEINNRMAEELAKSASESQGEVRFTDVQIADGKLKMTVEVQMKSDNQ